MHCFPAIDKNRQLSYKNYNIDFIRAVYGWQPFSIFFTMMFCIFSTILLGTFIGTGHSFKVIDTDN